MKLYEINKEIELTLQKIYDISEDGTISSDLSKQINDLIIMKEEKLLNCGRYYKNLEVEEKAIAGEVERLQKKRKSLQSKMSFLKNYISDSMAKDEKLKDSVISLSFRKSEFVSIDNIEKLSNEYIIIEKVPSKELIKLALKNGVIIEGAELKENYNLQIK